jgi:hypothetical protein
MMFSKPVLNRHFARHYAEMVAAMVVGMVALGIPAGWLLGAFGSGWTELRDDAPAAMLGLMAVTMTVPMSAWMYRMGHGWRANLEMAASMIVPTLGVIGLQAAGIVTDIGTLLVIEHVVMLAGMFVVMAARPEEYSGHHHHHEPAVA